MKFETGSDLTLTLNSQKFSERIYINAIVLIIIQLNV